MQSDFSDNCLHHYNIENLNLFDTELELVNTKQMIKNKLKELIIELKKHKVQAILVSAYKMKHLKPMHQSIMTKMKNYAYVDWIVLNVIIKHSIKIFEEASNL